MEKYGCSNRTTIDAFYDKKSKNNENNVHTVIKTITAYINSGKGGIIQLINKTTKGEKELEFFDKTLETELKSLGQEKHYNIRGWRTEKERYVFIHAVSDFVAKDLSSFKPYQTEVIAINCTKMKEEAIENEPKDLEQFGAFRYREVLQQTESDQIQFKEIKSLKNLDVAQKIVDKSSHCISAFANYYGGLIIFGITDKERKVVGTEVSENDRGEIVEKLCHKVKDRDYMQGKDHMQDKDYQMLWYQIKDRTLKEIQPQRHQHWNVEFRDIVGAPNGEQIIIVTVYGLQNGVVFTQTPECYFPPDGTTDEPCRKIGRDEWLSELKKYIIPEQGVPCVESSDDIPKCMEQLKLHDKTKPTFALLQSGGEQYAKKLANRFLRASPGCYCKRSDILPHREARNIINFVTRHCEKNESGVLIEANFGQLIDESTPPEDHLTDILLISDKKGVHLITCGQNGSECSNKDLIAYSKLVASKLDDVLKGCMTEYDTSQFLLVRHVTTCETFQEDLNFRRVPVPNPFKMRPSKMTSVLSSLAVLLSRFNSPFHHRIGAEYLNILTEEQFDILWPNLESPNDFLSKQRCFVHGLPGTGKTVIAIELAKRLGKRYGKESVLYVCKNRPLCEFVKSKDICKTETQFGWDKYKQMGRTTKHIIFDESHNFQVKVSPPGVHPNWFKNAENVLEYNNKEDIEIGFLWVFIDMSQKYNASPNGLPDCKKQQMYGIKILDKVIRNSVEIYSMARSLDSRPDYPNMWDSSWQRFYTDYIISDTYVAHSYEGEVKLSEDSNISAIDQVEEIILNHRNKLGDIVVLVSVEEDAVKLRNELRQRYTLNINSAGPSSLYHQNDDFVGNQNVKDHLIVESVRRYSGLERPIVIIYCLPKSPKANTYYSNWNRLFYQCITRAMSKVYVINEPGDRGVKVKWE